MKYTQGQFIITEKTAIARQIYSFTIACPEVAAAASAGQFVHIRAKGFTLRRPISICGIDKEKGTLRIVFEIRGEGTEAIAELNKGDLKELHLVPGAGHAHAWNVDPEAYERIIADFLARIRQDDDNAHTGNVSEHLKEIREQLKENKLIRKADPSDFIIHNIFDNISAV